MMHVRPNWPFENLTPLKYGGIMADPAWQYEMYGQNGYGKSPEAHYDTMSDEEIATLPVGHLASGDCILWLWAIWPKLPAAMMIMKRWGFTYKTGGSWTKTTRTGKRAFGTGYIFRSTTEPYLIGTMGNPKIGSRSVRNLIESPRRAHSQKPDEARRDLQLLCPKAFCVDLFAIEPWAGHDIWNPKPHREALA